MSMFTFIFGGALFIHKVEAVWAGHDIRTCTLPRNYIMYRANTSCPSDFRVYYTGQAQDNRHDSVDNERGTYLPPSDLAIVEC